MKLRLKRIAVVVAISAFLVGVPVFAQASSTMNDDHIAKIRANCQSALISLGQIHTKDIPTYINLNQTYYSISDKLMARLNSRLTLNRYDATQLVKIASTYNDDLSKFRAAYKNYNDSMADAMNISCNKEPVAFYDKATSTREARQKVHDAASQLSTDIDQYRQQVQAFETEHASALSGGASHE